MNKLLPLLAFSALLLVPLGAQNAFAGTPDFECTLTQGDMLSVQLPAGEQVTIQKFVECNDQPQSIQIIQGDCQNLGVDITFDNAQFGALDFSLDEIFDNISLGNDEGHCTQSWTVTSVTGATFDFQQELWFNEQTVGGELLSIDSSALVLAGLQTSAIWMLPILAGAAGTTAFYLKMRKN